MDQYEAQKLLPLVEQYRSDIAALCRRFGVAKLDVFGSTVTGQFNPAKSDLDLLVTFEAMDGMSRADQYFGLLQVLEDLFQRHIDLMTHQSLRNPYLIRAANESIRSLYAA